MPPEASPSELAKLVLEGDRSAVSSALNLVDDDRPTGIENARWSCSTPSKDAATAHASASPARRVRVNRRCSMPWSLAYADAAARSAFSPSTPRASAPGGALLGDRMRLGSGTRDAGVFLRSMAARDQTWRPLRSDGAESRRVLVAAFDAVFVETVGIGQSEAEVIHLVDSLVFVAQPAAGDLIQFMKAGILEWPDIFLRQQERSRRRRDPNGRGAARRTRTRPATGCGVRAAGSSRLGARRRRHRRTDRRTRCASRASARFRGTRNSARAWPRCANSKCAHDTLRALRVGATARKTRDRILHARPCR